MKGVTNTALLCLACVSYNLSHAGLLPAHYQFLAPYQSEAVYSIYALAGAADINFSGSKPVALNDELVNGYSPRDTHYTSSLVGMGMDYRPVTLENWRVTTGLGFFYHGEHNITGTVHPFVNLAPDFDALTYQYDLSSRALMSEVTFSPRFLLADQQGELYFLAGLGIGQNRLGNYREYVTDPTSTACPMHAFYQSKSSTHLATEVGGGVRFFVFRAASLGLEYRFMSFGEGEFAPTSLQSTTDSLSVGTITAHVISGVLRVAWS